MNEGPYDAYLRLRDAWHCLVTDPGEPLRSRHKDELFELISRAWNRLTTTEKRCAGMHCRMVYR